MQHLVNISIDDISPHPKSSIKVLDRCHELLQQFPALKFSLFIPVSYWRTIRPDIATQVPLRIDLYPEFCTELLNLPRENFEICLHGFYHGVPGKSDNDEFEKLNFDDTLYRFDAMWEVIRAAQLDGLFKSIFRPPAWRMSPGAIQAAAAYGIKILTLSPKEYAKRTYGGEDEKFDRVLYYNCNPPLDRLQLFDKTEIVYHACEWDVNYLSQKHADALSSWLESVQHNAEFAFIDEMV